MKKICTTKFYRDKEFDKWKVKDRKLNIENIRRDLLNKNYAIHQD